MAVAKPAEAANDAAPTSRRKPRQLRESSMLRLHFLSPSALVIVGLCLVAFMHLAGLVLFCRGFLLTRIAHEDRTSCASDPHDCTLPARHQRAIVLIIDALRYDFIFPVVTDSTAPQYSSFYHNVLTTPARLTAEQPANSIMFKAIADSPTTTLQRIKGLTVGTLPTFIDAGSNFVGSRAEEDTWLEQAHNAGKRIAFMGDDTWLTVFPASMFEANLTFPFDSFNVEDLDTVDEGVVAHLYPLLRQEPAAWDILIAHSLGLDHVGHRVGPKHPEMVRKLREADELVRRTIERMRNDDLLILMGDHGMDSVGNHGGDSRDEVEAALWMYSKTPLTGAQAVSACQPGHPLHNLLKHQRDACFTLGDKLYRSIPQISFVPTISLLLGLPIPFSNLGSIIPELFIDDLNVRVRMGGLYYGRQRTDQGGLSRALDLNVRQVQTLMAKIGQAMPSISEPLGAQAASGQLQEKLDYLARVLQQSRDLWATFDLVAMSAGLSVLILSALVCWRFYVVAHHDGALWRAGAARIAIARGSVGAVVGLAVALVFTLLYLLLRVSISGALAWLLGLIATGSAAGVLSTVNKTMLRLPNRPSAYLQLLLPFLHGAIFGSNSFTIWEDRVVGGLLQTSIAGLALRGITAKKSDTRNWIFPLSIIALLMVRFISSRSVCREEQHPHCEATFYPRGANSMAPLIILGSSVGLAYTLPEALKLVLAQTSSVQEFVVPFLLWGVRLALLGGSTYWYMDWKISSYVAGDEMIEYMTAWKNVLAQVVLLVSILGATLIWHYMPLCLKIERRPASATETKEQIIIRGHANAFGSMYLLFFIAAFALFWHLAQPVGQIVLGLGLLVGLCLLEANDDRRDLVTTSTTPPAPTFTELAVLALLGYALFFATGHQATLPSLQWKVAFVGFRTVVYPFAPLLVIGNTYAGFILTALAAPLLALWKVAPRVDGTSQPLLRNLFLTALGFSLYHVLNALPAVAFSAYFRRHLMVWKVFAPRFMLAGTALLVVDVTLIVGAVGWAGLGTLRKAGAVYKSHWS